MSKVKKLAPAKSGLPQEIETLKDDICMVVGSTGRDKAPGVKTSGTKTRGNGAATRGVTARGPMA